MDIPVESIAKLELKPGDVLVVKTAAPVNQAQRAYIQHALHQDIGITNKIVVLSTGMSFEILHPEDSVAPTEGG